MEICGVNTAKLPVLPNKKMRELLARIKEGDQDAREEMVQGNLRLVLSVIQRFNNRGELVDDLFQVGCIGLMKRSTLRSESKRKILHIRSTNDIGAFADTCGITIPFG